MKYQPTIHGLNSGEALKSCIKILERLKMTISQPKSSRKCYKNERKDTKPSPGYLLLWQQHHKFHGNLYPS